MPGRHLIVCAFALAVMTNTGASQSLSPNGVKTLFDDDIVEIDSVFYAPLRK